MDSEPHVSQEAVTVGIDQDVFCLDIAMNL
jgi:hypothetical protein